MNGHKLAVEIEIYLRTQAIVRAMRILGKPFVTLNRVTGEYTFDMSDRQPADTTEQAPGDIRDRR